MKLFIILVILLTGCFQDADDYDVVDEDSPQIKVQVVIDNEFQYINSGYLLHVPDCHSYNFGSCGGNFPVKVFGDRTVDYIDSVGAEFSIAPVALPIEGDFLFYFDYTFTNNKIYYGSIIIHSNDDYYSDGFIINLTGEKY